MQLKPFLRLWLRHSDVAVPRRLTGRYTLSELL